MKQITSLLVVFASSLLATQPLSAAATLGTTIPYAAPEIANPSRGQYYNLMTELFPQANLAQHVYASWPASVDTGNRYAWSEIQPTDPRNLPSNATDEQKYDFSVIDRDIAIARSIGAKFHFRIAMFSSCCDSSYPNNVNSNVPTWLRGRNGATSDYMNNGVTHVIPNWNNAEYLARVEDLIAALGRRYNKDERVAWYEFSGYGDFSENHNAFMRDTLNLPAVVPEQSIASLGYYSQYQDQYIHKNSIIRLVNATLRAFPDTQIVTTTGNPEIVKQFFRDSPELTTNVKKPVGIRGDCLGVFEPVATWAVNQWSWYVNNNDPIIPTVLNRWKTAPVITEWCNWVPNSELTYFDKALKDTVNYHVSYIASTGHPYQWSSAIMPQQLYTLWEKAAKFSGYRYAMSWASVPNVTQGQNQTLQVDWRNYGSAPTYDKWNVIYEIRNQNGQVIRETPSNIKLAQLTATQNYTQTNSEPQPITQTDNITLPTSSLSAGNYTVHAKVVWNERKSNGIYPISFQNMYLAQNGRDSFGAYKIGSFDVLAPTPQPTCYQIWFFGWRTICV